MMIVVNEKSIHKSLTSRDLNLLMFIFDYAFENQDYVMYWVNIHA